MEPAFLKMQSLHQKPLERKSTQNYPSLLNQPTFAWFLALSFGYDGKYNFVKVVRKPVREISLSFL